MKSRENRFQKCEDQLEILDKEHAEIHRQYIELDDAILQGEGSARILEAAKELAQAMGMHFTHEGPHPAAFFPDGAVAERAIDKPPRATRGKRPWPRS